MKTTSATTAAGAALPPPPPPPGYLVMERDFALVTPAGKCVPSQAIQKAFIGKYTHGGWTRFKTTLTQGKNMSYYYGYGGTRSGVSLSGPGSNLGSWTMTSIAFLAEVIREHAITSVADIPCGDANWQFESWEMDSIPIYVGLDIADKVIGFNQRRFAHHRNKRFMTWDFSQCPIPSYSEAASPPSRDGAASTVLGWAAPKPFDLVHVRDVIQHMKWSQATAALKHVFTSGCRFAMITTFPKTKEGNPTKGENLHDADYYEAQLASPPFDTIVPKPVKCIKTHPRHEQDFTCLYRCGDPPLTSG